MDAVAEVLKPEAEPVAVGESIAVRVGVREMVAIYEASAAGIRTAFATLAAIEGDLAAAFNMSDRTRQVDMHVIPSGQARDRCEWNPDAALARLERDAWWAVVARFELKRYMSADRWRRLEARMAQRGRWDPPNDGPMPEFNEANVMAFFAEQASAIPDMFTEKVRSIFDWLRPRKGYAGAKYKTNTELEVPAKVILSGAVETGRHASFPRVTDYYSPKLTELEAVFRSLDGAGNGTRGHVSDLETAIDQRRAERSDEPVETTYFRAKPHRNGTLHVAFLRLDLLRKLNHIAGGMNLRPAKETP